MHPKLAFTAIAKVESMEMVTQFRSQLAEDIYQVKQIKLSSINNSSMSFANFLGQLSDEKLEYYTDVILVTLEKDVPTQEELQRAVDFYSYIIVVLECEPPESINIDCEDKWLFTTFCFLMMEKFQREEHISDFSGFLKVGKPTYQQSKEMNTEMVEYINNIKMFI